MQHFFYILIFTLCIIYYPAPVNAKSSESLDKDSVSLFIPLTEDEALLLAGGSGLWENVVRAVVEEIVDEVVDEIFEEEDEEDDRYEDRDRRRLRKSRKDLRDCEIDGWHITEEYYKKKKGKRRGRVTDLKAV